MSVSHMWKSPREYDASINWKARLRREIPVLRGLFGEPGELPLLDAACGTGRHAVALARCGYKVVGTDISAEMVEFARTVPGADSPGIRWQVASFAHLRHRCPGPFAGIYCIGNSLSASGSADAIRRALRNFAEVLAPGGKLFIQVLNYPPMRRIDPCVRGPVHFSLDGHEFLRVRLFEFARTRAKVTNVTLVRDGKWTCEVMSGRLCVFGPRDLHRWCREAGLVVTDVWGSYAGEKLDPRNSTDLIVLARAKKRSTRRGTGGPQA